MDGIWTSNPAIVNFQSPLPMRLSQHLQWGTIEALLVLRIASFPIPPFHVCQSQDKNRQRFECKIKQWTSLSYQQRYRGAQTCARNTNNSGGMARRRLFPRSKENDEKVLGSRLFMIELRHGVHFGGDKDSIQTEMIFFNFLFCSRCENGDYTRTYVSEGKR